MVLLLSSESYFVFKVFVVLAHIQKWSCQGTSSEQESLWLGIGTKSRCGSEEGFSCMWEPHNHFLESHNEDLNVFEKLH